MFKNNKIYKIDKAGKRKRVFFISGLKISFKGKNSIVELKEPMPHFSKCRIRLGSDCKFFIDSSDYKGKRLGVKNLFANLKANKSFCTIGKNFSCTNRCCIYLDIEENLRVKIGDDCMFGPNITIRTTDGHTIVDADNKVLNYGKSVDIGDKVWLAENVTVLKGVNIEKNCVVAKDSVVTKSCDIPNSIYAGTPAKMVKTNINWYREGTKEYLSK